MLKENFKYYLHINLIIILVFLFMLMFNYQRASLKKLIYKYLQMKKIKRYLLHVTGVL